MRKKWTMQTITLAGILVFSAIALGCHTAPTVRIEGFDIAPAPIWSAYSFIPSMGYEVVGAVIVRNVNLETLLADLMEQAAAMGGHDIKNVRLSFVSERGPEGGGLSPPREVQHQRVTVATAVAIRYTEILMDADGNPIGLGGIRGVIDPALATTAAAPPARGGGGLAPRR